MAQDGGVPGALSSRILSAEDASSDGRDALSIRAWQNWHDGADTDRSPRDRHSTNSPLRRLAAATAVLGLVTIVALVLALQHGS